jgi:transcriptional regulator with XRE-family HTH domain
MESILKQERLRLNLTQRELADKVGVDSQTVGRWERRETSPYPYHRKKLYELLGILEQPDPVPSVYLAYAPDDEDYAHRLGQHLETQGFCICNNKEVTKCTPQWRDGLCDILRKTQAVVTVLSPHTRKDRVVLEELALAEQQHCLVLGIWIAGKRWKEVLPVQQTAIYPLDAIDARKDNNGEFSIELVQQLTKLSGPQAITVTPIDSPQPQRNPYKGLDPFGTKEEDAHDFFGRNQLIEDSIDQLEMLLSSNQQEAEIARLLAFIGPSGVGKSSFVLAGLLPRLQAPMNELPDSSQWIYLPPMHPGNHPVETLKEILEHVFRQKGREDINADLVTKDVHGLHTLTMQLTQDRQTHAVLVIDQFEELFTLTEDEQERQHFINLLMKASTEQAGNLIVILTLCTDSYDRVLAYTELGKIVSKQQHVVFPMTRDEVHAAITKPASHIDVQLDFETELVIHLLCDVEGQVGALPLLQFTLKQLADKCEGLLLTYQAYEIIGGIKGALSKHAESVYKNLSREEQELAQALFLRLVNPGKTEQDAISCRVSRSEFLLADKAKEHQLQKVIDTFVKNRLLTTGKQGETITIELSHRALIYGWKRLAGWIKEAREDFFHQKFKRDVNKWKQEGETERDLYTKAQLKEAQVWAKPHLLNRDETYFLFQSQWHVRQKSVGFVQKLVSVVLIAIMVIGGLVWIIPQLPAFASSIMVTNTQDDGPGSLRAAIYAAQSGGIIRFSPFLKGTIQLKSEDLNLTRNITLIGNNPNSVAISSLSGKKLHIARGNTVTINNLSFKDSVIQDSGIIYNEGNLTFNTCIISNNVSLYNGAGITNWGGFLTLNNSRIVKNTASGNGAGVFSWNGIVNINNTEISNNIAHANGAGVYSLAGSIVLNRSKILSNRSDGDGGGIDSVNGSLQLVNSTLTKNQSKGEGGGIAVLGSQGVIRQSSISQNTANWHGGGLSVEKDSENDIPSRLSMTDTIIRDNVLTTVSGTQDSDIRGTLTKIENSVQIASTNDLYVSGSPSPARPPEKLSHNYRGIGDPNAFCQAKGYNRSMLSEDQFTEKDVIACISQSGNGTENFTEQQVCQWQYPQDGTNIIGRLADFFDPASLQCYAHVQLLGEITTHLPAYCQSIHDEGAVLIHETNQTTAYDLKCQPHAGIPVGLSVTDACQWFYPQQDAFDRLDSFYSQNGWQCWAPK